VIRNTLPPLLQQLVAPVLQLRRGFEYRDLLDFQHFDSRGAVVAELCVWHLNYQICGVVVDVFIEFSKHLDCGADLGSRWCLHTQM